MSTPFKMTPTRHVGSTPTLIFGNDVYTCLIDEIILANVTDGTILVTLSIAREVTIGTETDFIFRKQVIIQPNDSFSFPFNRGLTLEAGDLLYAFSDYSSNLFNTFVSYHELTE